MVTLDTLREQAEMGRAALEQALLPIDTVVVNWPAITVFGYSSLCLQQGQPVFVPHAPTAGHVRLYHDDKRFMGIGEILDDGRVAPRRLLVS
jgi:tRNA pseudouridine55 synthase